MDQNENIMFMDAKVDLQDKRPESVYFKQWIRCQVKIEAVKCFPCFLRVTLETAPTQNSSQSIQTQEQEREQRIFTVSINVPGISLTLASSRTKQHSYALFWTHNRRSCHIYFALDTELSCRRHMKWIKKSIKNLELHRMLLLEERRVSIAGGGCVSELPTELPENVCDDSNTIANWSQRVSEIYEEIFEGNEQKSARLSRRCSRTSIGSGIYEEMRAPGNSSTFFDSINEESSFFTIGDMPLIPPPLPPLPPPRKRFNTFETEEKGSIAVYDEIPRCSTNPETDLAKKKKYKIMLDNIFHTGLRSKRTISINDDNPEQFTQTSKTTNKNSKMRCTTKAKPMERESPQIISRSPIPSIPETSFDDTPVRHNKAARTHVSLCKSQSKRNSFSSPDLSKINFIDTFDEQRIADLLHNSFSKCEELDLANCANLDESAFCLSKLKNGVLYPAANKSFESQNISGQIPNNFNFSACNNSGINLIAPLSSKLNRKPLKNKIIIDDLSGYCVMAPIVKKMAAIDNTPLSTGSAHILEPISSGYSTGSHCSSTSSYSNSTEEHKLTGVYKQKIANNQKIEKVETTKKEEENIVQENLQQPGNMEDFTGNLYENLMAVKAAQELGQQSPLLGLNGISTSTPTESPLLPVTPTQTDILFTSPDDESFYQTPRKSIISIDEKIPSYYPNSCESSAKSRRGYSSPVKSTGKRTNAERTPTSTVQQKSPSIFSTATGFTHLMSAKLRRERKENLYLTSPQALIEQRSKSKTNNAPSSSTTQGTKVSKSKKSAAHKISENVYTVTHRFKKSGTTSVATETAGYHNNNNIEGNNDSKEQQVQNELLQLAVLQNIDFKFEDTKSLEVVDVVKDEQNVQINNRAVLSVANNQILSPQEKVRMNGASCNSPATVDSKSSALTMSQSTITNTNNEPRTPESGGKKFASLPRFKKFDLSPLRTRINNVLQRNHTPDL